MRDRDVVFCTIMLRNLREEAKKAGIKVPKRMTALKSSFGQFYLVEGEGMRGKEVSAFNAYDAKCKIIEGLLRDKERHEANERNLRSIGD